MPFSNQGFNFILFAIYEVWNYVFDIPIQKTIAVTIAEALLNRVFYPLCPLKTLIIDEGRTLSADVVMHIYNTLNVRSQVIFPLNHGALRTKRYKRSINKMLCKHLKVLDANWYFHINPCCYALSTSLPWSMRYSAFKLVYLHKPADLTNIKYNQLQIFQDLLMNTWELWICDLISWWTWSICTAKKAIRTFPRNQTCAIEDLFYLFAPSAASLKTRTRKLIKGFDSSFAH